MRISALIPCHNEEKSIRKCVESCLEQTRPFDEIVVVNDGSTDKSGEILADFGDRIKVLTIPKATGNKSYVQERGLGLVTGDVFIATDGDTVLEHHFAEEVEQTMRDESITAVGGIVRSLKINWLTSCRAFEYAIGQNFHKLAQSYINFMFVIPGAAGAFRTDTFKQQIKFDHDTITEDLDFTYKFHKLGLKLAYNRKCISFTQDPTRLGLYINQVRRWYGGGFQNLKKHFGIIEEPVKALELSLIYGEGLVFSLLMFLLPLVNLYFSAIFFGSWLAINFAFGIWIAIKERRADVLWVALIYHVFLFINAYIFLEQFVNEIILGRKNLTWFQPERVHL